MASQDWWIQTTDEVLGPMPPARLRQLAADRLLHPDTLISQDRTRWVQAGKIRGLFPDPAGAPAPPPPERAPDSAIRPARPAPAKREAPQGRSAVERDGYSRVFHETSSMNFNHCTATFSTSGSTHFFSKNSCFGP